MNTKLLEYKMKYLALISLLLVIFFNSLPSLAQDEKKKEEPKTYTVGTPEVMPTFDMEELQKNIVYPKTDVEGQVLLKIKIDKYGKVVETEVLKTDSELLNKAAVDAVKKTKFTPARNGDEPVAAWVTLPIQFKLK